MIKIEPIKPKTYMLAITGKLNKATKRGLKRGLQRSGLDIIGKKNSATDGLVKKQMNAAKSGRTYLTHIGRTGNRLKKGRLYTASAVGQSPAVVSGALRRSLAFGVLGSNQLSISANTEYAAILEKGGNAGKNGKSRIGKRNYLRRPILQSRRNIINNVRNSILEFNK
jgi:phage gpG-like protein